MRYKGIYRLKAHIDQNTNDFPRDENGQLDTDDIYIKCANGSQIYSYGHGILIAYIPSLGRGHNILRSIAEDKLGIIDKISYDELFKNLEEEKTVFGIIENDAEIEFKFKSDNIEYISKYLKPQTSGSGISPFSTKNLPKSNYKIPDEDLDTYKNIMSNFYSESILDLTHNTNNFIKSLTTKRNPIEKIRADMKLKCLKTKEYIHSIGKWSEYMNYLKENK